MKQKKPLTVETVSQFVDAFGGTAALAEFLDVGMSCVSNWKRDNCIPVGWHLRLYLEAERRGIPVSEKMFGIDPNPFPFEPPRPRTRGRPRGNAPAAAA